MKYSIIAIGDELLAGQVTDTNSGMIARMLEPHGWELGQVWTVNDEPERILAAIESAFALTDVVLTTGGLGPTKDDLTKQTLCRYFGGELREDPAVLDNVRRIMAARSLTLNKLTAAQAMVPTSCSVIQNQVGTAPLMWFERDGKVLVAMPGVPFETERMMRAEVIDRLVARFPSADALERRVVMVHSMSESAIAEMLAEWEDSLPEYAHLAYLPTPGVVRLRIDGHHRDDAFLQVEMDRLHRELTELIPASNLLATADLKPEEALLERFRSKGLTFAAAESCTGGNVARRVTSVAGASSVFMGGVVSYSNAAKVAMLGVDADAIAAYGAVSEPVVCQMAAGARERFGADIAVATSGIAGPGGGSDEKPVGTVWHAVATASGVKSWVARYPGSRDRVIERASTAVILAAFAEA